MAQNTISIKTNSITLLYTNQGVEGWGQNNIVNLGNIVLLWYGTSQWVWYVDAPTTGQYYVDLLLSVPSQSSGYELEIGSEGNQLVSFTLEATNGFIHDNGYIDGNANYERTRMPETITISAGVNWIDLSSKNVSSGQYLMNLRGIALTPAGAGTEIDQAAVAQLMLEGIDPGKLRCWIHSHADMQVFWSKTDDECIQGLANGEWLLSLVVNKLHESMMRIDQFHPTQIYLEDVIWEVHCPIDPELEARCKAEFKKKVRESEFRPFGELEEAMDWMEWEDQLCDI